MVEYIASQDRCLLNIEANYYNQLDIEAFSQMMKDPSYCYKFYWLEAVVHIISEGKNETTFDEIINEMIANAWYSVREFHIHLSGIQADGLVRDGLERAILQLTELSDLPANASKIEIKNAIREHQAGLKKTKEQLTNMVPYRALAGFFTRSNEVPDWGSVKRITAYIQKINELVTPLPYVLGDSSKLKKEVHFHPDWVAMIQDNTVNILGWIQYEKVKWLQNNNPEVPGLIYKLAPMDEKMRKLSNVRKLWQGIMKVQEIRDIFTGQPVKETQYDVDHFIPWSFVKSDNLWNFVLSCPKCNLKKKDSLVGGSYLAEIERRNDEISKGQALRSPLIMREFQNYSNGLLDRIWAYAKLSGFNEYKGFDPFKNN